MSTGGTGDIEMTLKMFNTWAAHDWSIDLGPNSTLTSR
jgi:hypothetical protein